MTSRAAVARLRASLKPALRWQSSAHRRVRRRTRRSDAAPRARYRPRMRSLHHSALTPTHTHTQRAAPTCMFCAFELAIRFAGCRCRRTSRRRFASSSAPSCERRCTRARLRPAVRAAVDRCAHAALWHCRHRVRRVGLSGRRSSVRRGVVSFAHCMDPSACVCVRAARQRIAPARGTDRRRFDLRVRSESVGSRPIALTCVRALPPAVGMPGHKHTHTHTRA